MNPTPPSNAPDGNDGALPVDATTFRRVLGCLPTGVVVVTAVANDAPVGLAVGSFCSVSLDPPLVGFFATHTSKTLPHILDAGAFCGNVLAGSQEDVCRTFATSGIDKFTSTAWHIGRSGSPVLDEALAFVDCTIDDVYEAGDHRLVLGRVVDLGAGDGDAALVFFRGGYRSVSR